MIFIRVAVIALVLVILIVIMSLSLSPSVSNCHLGIGTVKGVILQDFLRVFGLSSPRLSGD